MCYVGKMVFFISARRLWSTTAFILLADIWFALKNLFPPCFKTTELNFATDLPALSKHEHKVHNLCCVQCVSPCYPASFLYPSVRDIIVLFLSVSKQLQSLCVSEAWSSLLLWSSSQCVTLFLSFVSGHVEAELSHKESSQHNKGQINIASSDSEVEIVGVQEKAR